MQYISAFVVVSPFPFSMTNWSKNVHPRNWNRDENNYVLFISLHQERFTRRHPPTKSDRGIRGNFVFQKVFLRIKEFNLLNRTVGCLRSSCFDLYTSICGTCAKCGLVLLLNKEQKKKRFIFGSLYFIAYLNNIIPLTQPSISNVFMAIKWAKK